MTSAFAESTSDECPHVWDDTRMNVPVPGNSVYKDDCAYCCRTSDDGIYVCMCCFEGVCFEHIDKHQALHPTHTLYTLVTQLPPKPVEADEVRDVNNLGIVAPPEYKYGMACSACRCMISPGLGLSRQPFDQIVQATSVAVQDGIANNTDANRNKKSCPHAMIIAQDVNPFTDRVPNGRERCTACECSTNNWMCLTCGAIGCPRQEAGGNQHAIFHFMMTGHPVVLKLGTVVNGTADLYCYSCDDEVKDEYLKQHCAHFGIDINTAVKSSKTLGEMMYDINAQHDFNSITEAGSQLTPRYGPGFTGLQNFGNTCYIASVVQCLFSFAAFRRVFGGASHRKECTRKPYDCHWCQVERLCDGMLSGTFASATSRGIAPRSFKKIFAKGNAMFSSGEQQDAAEYFGFLLTALRRNVLNPSGDATLTPTHDVTKIFDYVLEQRSQCSRCSAVRYSQRVENMLQIAIPVAPPTIPKDATPEQIDLLRPRVSLHECLSAYLTPSLVECRCDACKQPGQSSITQRLMTFPDVLVVNPRREYFCKESLSVKKLDVYVDAPLELDLSRAKGTGPQPDELLVAGDTAAASSSTTKPKIEVDELALATVVSMGIDVALAQWALEETSNDVERAIDFVFSHPEGPQPSASVAAQQQGSPSKPPLTTDGAPSYELTAMICHMGSSATTGHYVAHIKDPETRAWILFNDEKVAESKEPPFKFASLYFYTRK